MSKQRIAAYTGTRNIYGDMITSAKSLIAMSAVERVYMFCEDKTMGEKLPDIIEVKDISKQSYFPPDGPNMTSQYTYMAMMRPALCFELSKEYETVLTLDADTIAMRNCTSVWDIELGDCYFAASREKHRSVGNMLYVNVGVTLWNLERMRQGKAQECVDVMNRWRYQWVDQDVANYLCQGYIVDMPGEFNATDFTKVRDKPIIKHFAGVKHSRWANLDEVKYWRDMSWADVMELHEEAVEASL